MDVSILSLSVEDPASHDGMIRISEKLVKYLPLLPTGSRQKTVLYGDQLYDERGDKLSLKLVHLFLYNTLNNGGLLFTLSKAEH